MKKYGEDVAIVEENPKPKKIYDNNLRQGEEIVIKKGTPTIKKLYYENINGQPTIKKEEIIEEGSPTVIRVGTKGIVNDLNVSKSDM
ncbi:G5 domain-containing protein [Finegoldia magna]|uniref:G5 domain-containing protein n=1 Tax=Finegoldia magna TaxID=1260 RepID=UPI002805B61E|nr:G5 domain-containing protein [Finegoldia magna]MDU4277737.1 G5 domain-containing protein [Finegoldia magna]MDU5070297.1 G5 domain-containing protein [Finegoldia magna]MDU7298170.1 G5 domain-containing protein [Finegoldia magna]